MISVQKRGTSNVTFLKEKTSNLLLLHSETFRCPIRLSNNFLFKIFSLPTFPKIPVVVYSLSRVQLFVTPWTAAHQASLSFTVSWNLLKLMYIELSNQLIFCRPLLLLPSISRVYCCQLRIQFSYLC